MKNSKGVKIIIIIMMYMHNPDTVSENATHKLLWNVETQTDHLISARRLDFIMIKKGEFA